MNLPKRSAGRKFSNGRVTDDHPSAVVTSQVTFHGYLNLLILDILLVNTTVIALEI